MPLPTAYVTFGFLSLIVAAIFGYLALLARREIHYRFWCAAYFTNAVRQLLNGLDAMGASFAAPLVEIAYGCTLALTIIGTLALIGRVDRWRAVFLATVVAVGWLPAAAALGLPWFWQTLPIYALAGIGMLATGAALLRRHRVEPGVGLHVLAALLILWGIQLGLHPALRGVEWYRPASMVANLCINVGVVLFLIISALRRAEFMYRNSEGQLRNLADNLPMLIMYVGTNARIRFINRSGRQWYAEPDADMVDRPLESLLPPDHLRAIERAAGVTLAGQPAHFELNLPYPDGVTRVVDVFFIPDRAEREAVRGVFAVATDVSERRATEAQLRQSQKMEAIGQLTGGVAHDFNNLLAVISGNLELLDGALAGQAELREIVARATNAVDRGATLTRSLLAFARQQPLQPRVTEIGKVVREMTDLLRRAVPEAIDIELINAAGLWRCEVDVAQLQNALLNLVLNARDAMPEGGKLTIETANARLDDDYAAAHADVSAGQYVMLAVSDSGIGMTPDVVARAFDPFFTTKRGSQGTGLGLSMVYGFAKQSGGHVKIYSEAGHGTTVKLYLPRSMAVAEPAEAVATSDIGARGQGETVLVVEDDDDMRRLTIELVQSLGYRALPAAQAEQALELLAATPDVALLLSDVMLPGAMNGRQLAEQAVRQRPALRVLYMSGYTENAVIHHGRLDPGVQLLQKPFRRRDLALKLRAVLEAAPELSG